MPTGRQGFSLVELLVVIAIIALLISVLLPSLGKAREVALAAVCATNMRQIGAAGIGFATEHRGRSPGRAHRIRPTGSSISWVNILNDEYFKAETIQRMGRQPADRQLYCPVIGRAGSNLPVRAYAWNLDAAGGPNWGGFPEEGVYGRKVDPTKINPNYDQYNLGAKFEWFRFQSFQFLAIESERASDYANSKTDRGPVEIGVDPLYPPHSTLGGSYAFRHMRTGNFQFIDGHGDSLSPNDDIDLHRRFRIKDRY